MPILAKDTAEFPENLLDVLPQGAHDRGWWLVYTKPRQEKALARQLVDEDIPFFLPLVPKENLIRAKKVRSYLPLFVGYLFMYGSAHERIQALTTKRIAQMIDVRDNGQLTNDLRNIRNLINMDVPLTIESRLKPGTLVRVMKGSLAGLEGTIVRRQNASRLVVSVNYLNQGVSVEIDDFMVESV